MTTTLSHHILLSVIEDVFAAARARPEFRGTPLEGIPQYDISSIEEQPHLYIVTALNFTEIPSPYLPADLIKVLPSHDWGMPRTKRTLLYVNSSHPDGVSFGIIDMDKLAMVMRNEDLSYREPFTRASSIEALSAFVRIPAEALHTTEPLKALDQVLIHTGDQSTLYGNRGPDGYGTIYAHQKKRSFPPPTVMAALKEMIPKKVDDMTQRPEPSPEELTSMAIVFAAVIERGLERADESFAAHRRAQVRGRAEPPPEIRHQQS